MKKKLNPIYYVKAVAAGVAAGLAFAIPVVDDGLVASEILGIALAILGGAGIVYRVPNKTR
jgi:hypothetical protein